MVISCPTESYLSGAGIRTLHFQITPHQYVTNSPRKTESHCRAMPVGLMGVLITQCVC